MGNSGLPKDPRTLLRTPRNVEISTIGENQQYWHYGLKLCLENIFSNLSQPITISLNINMDGLPVYKAARDEMWPILFNINEFPHIRPMVIGVYNGVAKASNLEKYLSPMVTELKTIMQNGLTINDNKVTVKLRCIIADSPGRAFIKGKNEKNPFNSRLIIYVVCRNGVFQSQTSVHEVHNDGHMERILTHCRFYVAEGS